MMPLIQFKPAISSVLTAFVLLWLALLPNAQAVVPAPDGGYPGGNTAEGLNALFSLASGTHDTAVGDSALRNNRSGDNNTATGFFTLRSNTFGNQNTANGALALANNETGKENTAIGFEGLLKNTTGNRNTATGNYAMELNTTGDDNTATGWAALHDNTTGNRNTANGSGALFNNTTGIENTANGLNALRGNTSGMFNSANGVSSLYSNTTGDRNTANGFRSLFNNMTGSSNVAFGDGAGSGVITADDVICIGHGVPGANVSGTCFIGNIRGVTTQNANALPVLIDGAGQLGTASSSQRFKHDIKPMGTASEALLALNPVTFHYKSDQTRTPQFGLIAEEVAKANPDLVVRDENGEIYTVRYDAVNAMLLNEFLKERREVQQLKEQVAALTAGLQKVSVQLEANKSAPQVAASDD